MLVTFLVFAFLALLILVILLWQLWPSSRISTSVPGISPSVETLGNVPDIRDAGGIAKFLKKLHGDHGLIASFWINDFLAISLSSASLFKLVNAGNSERPYQSIVPITSDQDVLESVTKADGILNNLLSTFAPFSSPPPRDLENSVQKLVDELIVALTQLRDDDQIPIEDYMTALSVKIVSETSPSVVRKNLDSNRLRSLFAQISAELDLFLDFGAPDFDAEQKNSLSKNITEFCQMVEGADGRSLVFSQIFVISSLATWALYYLAKLQTLQTKLWRGTDVELRMFLTEVVRVTSLVPLRSAVLSQSLTLLGHTVAEGTLVISSLSSHYGADKTFPSPADIDISRQNCADVLSLIHSEAANSYSFQVVLLIVRQFLKTFYISPAHCEMNVDQKFRLVTKPDCDIWLKLKRK